MQSQIPDDKNVFPVFTKKNTSLLKKYLSKELFEKMKPLSTKNGFSLFDLIRSGVTNPDSSIGVYAGDMESFQLFADLLDPITSDYHGYLKTDNHKKDFTTVNDAFKNPDPTGHHIISTRIRVGRNLAGYPLGPCISREKRNRVENKISGVLEKLKGELSGSYHPITEMEDAQAKQLTNEHLLFKQGDRFLEAAGLNRHWPEGRGIYFNRDRSFLVWVNEEDQLRIISMEQSGDIERVYNRLARAVAFIEKELEFLYDDHLGYITSCPTNLGTAMRASVHTKLPHLGQNIKDFQKKAEQLNLQIRGIHGEHSESVDGIFDISNKRRLGLTEKECIQELYDGVVELIEVEKGLSLGSQ